MADPDRRTTIDGDQITDHSVTPEELDTDNTPQDEYVIEYSSALGKMFWSEKLKSVSIGQNRYWNITPTFNGILYLLGFYRTLNAGQLLNNATPRTTTEAGYGSYFVIQVTGAVGTPFNLTITGHTINEDTGVITPNDTEVISITGNAYYRTTKLFIGTGILTVPVGASCTISIWRTVGWDNNDTKYYVDALRMEFTPSSTTWEVSPSLYKLNTDGTRTTILQKTIKSTDVYPNASRNLPGKYEQLLNFTIEGAVGEGLIIDLNQTGLFSANVEIIYHV